MGDLKNETSSSTLTCDVVDSSAKHFFMLVYSLVFLLGLLLNGFIMKFYFTRAQQQASSSLMVYLKNLTAADFLLCLSLPLRISHYASSSVIIQRLYCSFGASAFFLNMYASIIFMGYIAVNRYLKIIHPSGTHILQTVRAARIISMVTWVFLLVPKVAYTILFFITQKPLTSAPSRCGLLFSASVSMFFKIIHTSCTIIFLLVLIPLLFFYYSISRRVLVAQQRQLTSSGSEKLVKSRRNMLLLVSVFSVCFVPYHLVRLPSTFLWTSCSVGQVLYYLKEAATMVSVSNVCLDPLVYFFLCKTFRAQVNLRMSSRRTNIQQRELESSKKQLDIVTATSQTCKERFSVLYNEEISFGFESLTSETSVTDPRSSRIPGPHGPQVLTDPRSSRIPGPHGPQVLTDHRSSRIPGPHGPQVHTDSRSSRTPGPHGPQVLTDPRSSRIPGPHGSQVLTDHRSTRIPGPHGPQVLTDSRSSWTTGVPAELRDQHEAGVTTNTLTQTASVFVLPAFSY